MCRWFAYISDSEPCLLDDVLIRPAHSLTKQVHSSYLPHLFHHTTSKTSDAAEHREIATHNIFVNSDGTGVVLYSDAQEEFGEADGLRPQSYRTIQPPLNDPNFISLCTHSASTVVLAHLRMATSVVQPFNNHPFIFGRHSFMHNGEIDSFKGPVRLAMTNLMSAKAYENILGSTDSEHLAGLYFSFLGDDWDKIYPSHEMKAALEKAIQTVLDIQRDLVLNNHVRPELTFKPSNLNLCTTDGEKLLAVRFTSSQTGQPPSLYISTTAGATLNRKYVGHPNDVKGVHALTDARVSPEGVESEDSKGRREGGPKVKESHGRHVIVASEPSTFDQDEWALVGKNEFVLVEKDMSVSRVPVSISF